MCAAKHCELADGRAESDALVAEAQRAINKYLKPGAGPQASVQAYNDTSEKYDKYNETFEYTGPQQAAKTVGELYGEQSQRDKVRILDVAAGTGRVGEELHRLGFRLMDALDPSQGMLDVAARKGVYGQLFTEYINDTILPIPENSYDVITIAGGMGENHVPCSALREMVRLVKPGGYIVNVTRSEILVNCSDYIGRLEQLMERLEQEGRWKQVTRDTFSNYLRGKDGIVMVHQVL